MSETIYIFRGEYAFLSNFYPVDIEYGDITYPSVEHAYQAAKTHDERWHERIVMAKNPNEAKRLGKRVPLRGDWEEIKLTVMLDCLRSKFSHRELGEKLLATGTARLVEGNTWRDTFWGMTQQKTDAAGIRRSNKENREQPKWVGENWLGKLLMQVRQELLTGKL